MEEENARLTQIVADLSLDKQMLHDILKKVLRPAQKKVLAEELTANYRVSALRACQVVLLQRPTLYYKPHRREDRSLLQHIREIASARIRYGHWRIYTLLRREGWQDNHKRVYSIYKEEGLNLRNKRPFR